MTLCTFARTMSIINQPNNILLLCSLRFQSHNEIDHWTVIMITSDLIQSAYKTYIY